VGPRVIGFFEEKSLKGVHILLKTPAPKLELPRDKKLRARKRNTWHA